MPETNYSNGDVDVPLVNNQSSCYCQQSDDDDSACTNPELARIMHKFFPTPVPSQEVGESSSNIFESYQQQRSQTVPPLKACSSIDNESDENKTTSLSNFFQSFPIPYLSSDSDPPLRSQAANRKVRDSNFLNPVIETVIDSADNNSTSPSIICYDEEPSSRSPKTRSDWNMDPEDIEVTLRALRLQEDLRREEMMELALEAERAAEAGKTRFVGEATAFTLIESSILPDCFDNDDHGDDQQQLQEEDTILTGGSDFFPLHHQYHCATPPQVRRRAPLSFSAPSYSLSNRIPSLLRCETNTFPTSPSRSGVYYRKKRPPFLPFHQQSFQPQRSQRLAVRSLRRIGEVIPPFTEIHPNLRMHLSRSNINHNVLTPQPPSPKTNSPKQEHSADLDKTQTNAKEKNALVRSKTESNIQNMTFDPIQSIWALKEQQEQLCMKTIMRSLPAVLNCGDLVTLEEKVYTKSDLKFDLQNTNSVFTTDAPYLSSDQENDNKDNKDAIYVSILASEINDPEDQELIDASPLPPSPYSEDEDVPINLISGTNKVSPWVAKMWKTFENFVPPSPIQSTLTITNNNNHSFNLDILSLDRSPSCEEVYGEEKEHDENPLNEYLIDEETDKNNNVANLKQLTSSYYDDNATFEDRDLNDSLSVSQADKCIEDCTHQESCVPLSPAISIANSDGLFSNLRLELMEFQSSQSYQMVEEAMSNFTRMEEKLDNASRLSRNTESTSPLSDDSTTTISRCEATVLNSNHNMIVKNTSVTPLLPSHVETKYQNKKKPLETSYDMTMSIKSKKQLNALCSRFDVPTDTNMGISIEENPIMEPGLETEEQSEADTQVNTEEQPVAETLVEPQEESFNVDETLSTSAEFEAVCDPFFVLEGDLQKDQEEVAQIDENPNFCEGKLGCSSTLLGDVNGGKVSPSLDDLNPSTMRSSPIGDFLDQVGRLSPFGWKEEENKMDDKSDIVFVENYFFTPVKRNSASGATNSLVVNGEKKTYFCDTANKQCTELGTYVGCEGWSSAMLAVAKVLLPQEGYTTRGVTPCKLDIAAQSYSFISQEERNDDDPKTSIEDNTKDSHNMNQLYRPPRLQAKRGALQACIDEDDSFSVDTHDSNMLNDWTLDHKNSMLPERIIDESLTKAFSDTHVSLHYEEITEHSLFQPISSRENEDRPISF